MIARLAAAITREAPAGIGAWPTAWEMVDEPSRLFLEELLRVEQGKGDAQVAVRLGQDVLAAWRRAAMKWRAAEAA